jgi:stage V sporulation protein D (sporulation-specific penicillin-binding protein)
MPSIARRDGTAGEIVYAMASSKAILMPDLRGRSVRDVARACAQLGLQVEARGDGHVVRQSPAAGMEVGAGQIVSVDFARDN